MRGLADLRAWAATRYRHAHRAWLARGDLGARVVLEYGLQPPSEQQVAQDPAAAAGWVAGWRSARLPTGASVEWELRRWRSFGEQSLPVRVRIDGSDAVAELAGSGRAWRDLTRTAAAVVGRWPTLAGVLPRVAAALGRLGPGDLERLLAVVEWFALNPQSELLARQVPVEGVDTKWLERHRGLVTRLVEELTGEPGLGLRVEPRRFRVRLLGAARPDAGVADLTAEVAELARLPWRPDVVLVCENLQTVAALPASGVELVAVHGNGLAAPALAEVPWLRAARVLYWGDLDTYGLSILSMVRQVLPQTESLLMDAATLGRFAALAGTEPRPYRGPIGHLTSAEQDALAAVRAADARLEQERIPLDHAVASLHAALQGSTPPADRLAEEGLGSAGQYVDLERCPGLGAGPPPVAEGR
nr:hypothetical protein [Propionibacterium sp.]